MVSSFIMKLELEGRQKGSFGGVSRSLRSIGMFIFLYAVLPQSSFVYGGEVPVDAEKVKEFVIQHNNTDMSEFTYEQLQQWFENKSAEYAFKPWDYPRAFPFCVTRRQIIQGNPDTEWPDQPEVEKNKPVRVPRNSKLFKFERYIYAMELRKKKFYQFNEAEDSTVRNKKFVLNMKLTRINTPEPDMANLRQWTHITVQTNGTMMGLYMQAIVGPYGLPFGEFSTEFNCDDEKTSYAPGSNDKADNIDQVGDVAYCSYRPNTNVYHPSVYVGVSEKENLDKGREYWHVHYKWLDLACMETPYIQFLMLVVKKFTKNPIYGIDFVAQLSPVFENTGMDSKDGSPYPYYPAFTKQYKMWCFIKDHGELAAEYKKIGLQISNKGDSDGKFGKYEASWKIEPKFNRIRPNEEYDTCILYDKSNPNSVQMNKTQLDSIKQDDVTYECGPGPFQCDVEKGGTGSIDIKEREGMLITETNLSTCYPCGVPECLAVGFDPDLCGVDLPEVVDLRSEINVLTTLDDSSRVSNHGVAGMLAFLFFIPIGNFVGRFYKEVMGKCCLGNGPWIFVHILCSMLSIVAIWSSMGPMVPTMAGYRARKRVCDAIYNTSLGSEDHHECMANYIIKSPHSITGLIAFGLLHFCPIFGFIRPSSHKLRFLMSTIHSSLSYFTFVLGVVSVFFALMRAGCPDIIVFASILIVLPFVFSIIVIYLDCISDKSIGVQPSRSQFPVLEQLTLESSGPLQFPKLIVLAVFVGLMSLTWMMAVISLHVVSGSGDDLLDSDHLTAVKGPKGLVASEVTKGLQGIFGPCTGTRAAPPEDS